MTRHEVADASGTRFFRPPERAGDRVVQAFVLELLRAWRARFEVASLEERGQAIRSLSDLRSPVFIEVVSVLSPETGLITSAARFVRDNEDRGDTIHVSSLTLGEVEALREPQLRLPLAGADEERDRDSDENGWLRTVRHALPGMTRLLHNWRPGRAQSPATHAGKQRTGGNPPECFWSVWGPFNGLSIDALIEEAFHVDEAALPSAPRVQPPPPRRRGLLTSLPSQEQEPEALFREIGQSLHELLLAAGGRDLPPSDKRPHIGWWCIPCAPRALVFENKRLSGDTDLLAGPMYLDVPPSRLREVFEDELRAAPLERHDSFAWSIAIGRLIADGHLLWPPPMDFLLAVEFKLSYFDTTHDESMKRHPKEKAWKRTHEREQRRILGQLSVAKDAGVDRVSLFHLGVTRPRFVRGQQGIILAAGDAGTADDQFPHLFSGPASKNAELSPIAPPFGHITKCLGGTTIEAEHDQGATTMPALIQDGREAIGAYRVETRAAGHPAAVLPWRSSLQRRLASLPMPKSGMVAIALTPTGEAMVFDDVHELQLARR